MKVDLSPRMALLPAPYPFGSLTAIRPVSSISRTTLTCCKGQHRTPSPFLAVIQLTEWAIIGTLEQVAPYRVFFLPGSYMTVARVGVVRLPAEFEHREAEIGVFANSIA